MSSSGCLLRAMVGQWKICNNLAHSFTLARSSEPTWASLRQAKSAALSVRQMERLCSVSVQRFLTHFVCCSFRPLDDTLCVRLCCTLAHWPRVANWRPLGLTQEAHGRQKAAKSSKIRQPKEEKGQESGKEREIDQLEQCSIGRPEVSSQKEPQGGRNKQTQMQKSASHWQVQSHFALSRAPLGHKEELAWKLASTASKWPLAGLHDAASVWPSVREWPQVARNSARARPATQTHRQTDGQGNGCRTRAACRRRLAWLWLWLELSGGGLTAESRRAERSARRKWNWKGTGAEEEARGAQKEKKCVNYLLDFAFGPSACIWDWRKAKRATPRRHVESGTFAGVLFLCAAPLCVCYCLVKKQSFSS